MEDNMCVELKIVCDCRETFAGKDGNGYSDHFSQTSINFIISKIQELGYSCVHFGGINELISLCSTKKSLPNEYFINFSDGLYQKNRRLQAPILLEILDTNYSGSEPFAIALANNKSACKKILASSSIINIPEDVLIDNNNTINIDRLQRLHYPVIVKPNAEGSSIGITQRSLVLTPDDVISYYNSPDMSCFDSVLVEKYISGYEVTSLIIGNNDDHIILPLLIYYNNKCYFDNEIMDIEVKRSRKRDYIHPNKLLSENCINNIMQATTEVKRYIGLRDIARVDFRITKEEEIFFIEVNSNPVLSGSSELGAICRIYNTSESQLLSYYVETFLNRVRS